MDISLLSALLLTDVPQPKKTPLKPLKTALKRHFPTGTKIQYPLHGKTLQGTIIGEYPLFGNGFQLALMEVQGVKVRVVVDVDNIILI